VNSRPTVPTGASICRDPTPPRRTMPDMPERTFAYGASYAEERATSTAQLLGQVMFLVAVGLGFLTVGTQVGKNLDLSTARICSFAGFGMLLVASFAGRRFRVGTFAMGWYFATALLIGLGLGPVIQYFATTDEAALTQAAGATALIVLGCGATGFALSKDLARWMRPLSFVVLGLVGVSLVLVFTGDGGNPILSLAIGGISALLIVVDFNYLRKHGDADDAIWLATGIFVSIVNIFLSLLNLFSGR
jgi:modulator of FtsH protease